MKSSNFCLLFIVAVLITLKTTQAKTPIIGIVSIYSESWDDYNSSEWNYIPRSYVRWLQSAGAKVVPIQWDLPFDQIDYLLDRLNGVVFTGGNIGVLKNNSPTPIYNAFRHITEYILRKNQHCNFYPLWGTCMGFWNIVRTIARNMSILTPCDDCIYVRRNVYPKQSYKSKMLRNLPQDLRKKMNQDRLSVFLHHGMIMPQVFQKSPRLRKYLTPVAYSYDVSGKQYVSMAESPRYPIYATQFHPEKPEFERNPQLDIPHSPDAIRFTRYLANFFVGEARKNHNVFPNSKSYLIENYCPVPLPSSVYSEVYFFPAYNSSEKELEGEVESRRK